jgi:hypothetical protein
LGVSLSNRRISAARALPAGDVLQAAELRCSLPGAARIAWIDPDLGFPLQIKLPDGVTFTATIVRQPENAADRFEIPATFRKFDPAALVDRIRQSDVWVEPH